MKKTLFVMGLLSCMMAIGVKTAYAQQVRLDDAIRSASAALSAGVDMDSRIAVLAMQADPVRMSDFLINEMIAAFVGMGMGRFTVVNRAQLDLLAGELHFNLSGYVDDATAQSIGRFMGVQSIVTGTFESLGGFFRFRVQIVEVETAAIRGVYTADVQNDAVIAYLRGTMGVAYTPVPAPPVQIANFPGQTFNHFTAGQRWGTWALNWLVPGLGSFVVMGDRFGGGFQIVCMGLGTVLYFVGIVGREVYQPGSGSFWTGYYVWEPNMPALVAGTLLILTSFTYNIVRSITFMRNAPTPRMASVFDPDAWNIAIKPGRSGIEQVSLSHTLRF
ncbi:MAG: hypothetical protein FWB78_04105 [Treponema sp.]|nr:hypothetical protein [Treponema sp.]